MSPPPAYRRAQRRAQKLIASHVRQLADRAARERPRRLVQIHSSRSRSVADDPAVPPILVAVATIELEEIVTVVGHHRPLGRPRVLEQIPV